MKRLLILIGLVSPCFGQAAFYQFPVPLPGATFRVCPVGVQNPCPSPASIFADQALTLPISQPAQTGPTGQFGFWVGTGQYTIQIGQPYNFVYVVNLGGGGGGGSVSFSPLIKASVQLGATSDVQISNAIAALTGGNGIIWLDYSTNQTWAACPTWGSGNVHVILYPVTFSYSGAVTTCTIPANITLQFMQGAMLSPATGKVFNLLGNITTGVRQIFTNSLFGQGTVDFTGNLAVQTVYPEWWGASPSAAAAVNTPAIQASIWGAYGCGPDVCRVNGNAGLVYNKILQFSGVYSINGTLNVFHMNGFHWLCLERLTCGIKQTAANSTILNGQSDTYGTFEKMAWSTSASQNLNSPLVNLDFDGSQGADLKPQFIDFKENNWNGNFQAAIGFELATSGGAAQGSNVYFHNNFSTSFTEAAYMIGKGSGGSPTNSANNAIATTWFGGDIQFCNAYGIEDFGGGHFKIDGMSFENGFGAQSTLGVQTGYDIWALTGAAGELIEVDNVRSESLFFLGGPGPYTVHGSFNADQAPVVGQGSNLPVNSTIQGSGPGGHGVYYNVTVQGAFGGLGTVGSPKSASGGSATTLVDSIGGLTVNAWVGWSVSILGGTGANTYCIVTSNSATTFTCSGGFLTDFINVSIASPDGTTTYIVEPNWGTQFTSGGATWAVIAKKITGISFVDGLFIPGLQISVASPQIYRGLQVTRADWLSGFPENLFVNDGLDAVLAGEPSGGPGTGSGTLGDLSLLRSWRFSRNGITGLSNPAARNMGTVPNCWLAGLNGGGTATVDICAGADPSTGTKNGLWYIKNNSSGSTKEWDFRADSSTQFPSVTFSTLPASPNGSMIFCSDCNATCTAGASTGRTCFRENGAWTH